MLLNVWRDYADWPGLRKATVAQTSTMHNTSKLERKTTPGQTLLETENYNSNAHQYWMIIGMKIVLWTKESLFRLSSCGCVIVWATCSSSTLGHLIPAQHWLKYFDLPDYTCWPCPRLYDHKILLLLAGQWTKIRWISNGFLEFTVLQWPLAASTFSSHQPPNLQQLTDNTISQWTDICEEWFWHCGDSIIPVLKENRGPTR